MVKEKIKNLLKDQLVIWKEKGRMKEKKEMNKELETRCNISLINEKKYNLIYNFLKPLKAYTIVKGETYFVEGYKHKERIFFDCIKSGTLIVRYNHINGEDVFSFGGTGRLKPNEQLTEGFGE